MWRSARKGDVIVAKTDPPLLSIVLAPIAKLRGAHLVNWLQDIFPEVAEKLNIGGSAGRLFCQGGDAASKLVSAIGKNERRGRRRHGCASRGARYTALEDHGRSTTGLTHPSSRLRRSKKTSFVRSGCRRAASWCATQAISGGRTTSETALSAMTLLQDRAVMSPTDPAAKVMFLFVGGGAKRAKLEREAVKRGLTNFRMRPYQPKENLSETLGVGDVHLVSLVPKLEGLIVPSKFYGIAAAGRPQSLSVRRSVRSPASSLTIAAAIRFLPAMERRLSIASWR